MQLSYTPDTQEAAKWINDLGDPLGDLAAHTRNETVQQSSPFFSLSSELMEIIFCHLFRKTTKIGLLLSCKSCYKKFHHHFSWVDVRSTAESIVGNQITAVNTLPCYTALFTLFDDYTFTSIESQVNKNQFDPEGILEFQGYWSLHRQGQTPCLVLRQTFPEVTSCTSNLAAQPLSLQKQLTRMRKTDDQWAYFHGIPPTPQRQRKKYKCGVPPAEQVPDTPCCTEEVTILANQLWPLNFPEKDKSSIILEVATACMKPPGMSDSQLKVAIAQLIAANH